jgi:signal transduction histidine kinase
MNRLSVARSRLLSRDVSLLRALGASVVLLAVMAAVALTAVIQLKRDHEAVSVTTEFLREVNQVRSLVDELDLLEHRYLLLADERLRSKAETLREHLNNTLLQLEQSPQSIARQVRPFPRLYSRSLTENGLSAEPVGYAHQLDFEVARTALQAASPADVLSSLRSRLAELHSADSLLLSQQTSNLDQSHSAWTASFFVIAAVVSAWMLLLTFVFWRRAIARAPAVSSEVRDQDQPAPASVHTGGHDIAGLVEAARDEERARIARDIHDDLGALLMAIKIELKCSAKTSAPGRRAVDSQWAVMLEHVDAAMNTVARIAEQLRPSIVDRVGLWPAIESLLKEFEDTTGVSCRLNLNMDIEDCVPSDDVAVEVFRIVQESLVNVARHAEASRVEVTVDLDNATPRIQIVDDGKGITPAQILSPHSVGIAGMFERAKLFGGDIQLQGSPDKGTRVTLHLPSPAACDPSIDKSLDSTLAGIAAPA